MKALPRKIDVMDLILTLELTGSKMGDERHGAVGDLSRGDGGKNGGGGG